MAHEHLISETFNKPRLDIEIGDPCKGFVVVGVMVYSLVGSQIEGIIVNQDVLNQPHLYIRWFKKGEGRVYSDIGDSVIECRPNILFPIEKQCQHGIVVESVMALHLPLHASIDIHGEQPAVEGAKNIGVSGKKSPVYAVGFQIVIERSAPFR